MTWKMAAPYARERRYHIGIVQSVDGMSTFVDK